MTEEWKPIPGFTNYFVSNLGRVLSFAQSKPKYLKQLESKGYRHVVVCNHGATHRVQVHRLVANAFCPKVPGKEYVNHINGIKSDNRAENLEWVTAKENIAHARDTLGVDYHILNGLSRPIVRSDGKVFKSITEASRETGCRRANIQLVLRGKRSRCGGYGWRNA